MPTGAKRWELVLAPPETNVPSPPKFLYIGEGQSPPTGESTQKLMPGTRFECVKIAPHLVPYAKVSMITLSI